MQDAWQLELSSTSAFRPTVDWRAQENLYQLCRKVALSVCRTCRDDAYIDDLAQFLALQLWEKGDTLRSPAPEVLRSWLWETGRRELWRLKKQENRQPLSLDDETDAQSQKLKQLPDPQAIDAEEEMLILAVQQEIVEFLEREVSQKQLAVAAVLLTNPDATQQELAESLGISQPCVGKRYTRFRIACRAFLGDVNNSLGARALLRVLEHYRGD